MLTFLIRKKEPAAVGGASTSNHQKQWNWYIWFQNCLFRYSKSQTSNSTFLHTAWRKSAMRQIQWKGLLWRFFKLYLRFLRAASRILWCLQSYVSSEFLIHLECLYKTIRNSWKAYEMILSVTLHIFVGQKYGN